jgi:hypothetical protein
MSQNAVLKSFTGLDIKDVNKGEVEAIVATLGVVDKDGDIIRPGSIGKGAKVKVSAWGHDAVFGQRPVGKGVLVEEGGKLKFSGKLFLSTANGRETFEVLKELGSDTEWSFGFRVLGAEVPSDSERKAGASQILTKLDAFEVSPVLIGAGIGTRTTSIKSASQADGDGEEVVAPIVDPELAIIAEAVTKQVMAQREAERKAAADTEAAVAEAARIEAETKAQAEAAAAEVERARLADLATKEFERLQRNLRQHSA